MTYGDIATSMPIQTYFKLRLTDTKLVFARSVPLMILDIDDLVIYNEKEKFG